LGWTLIQRGAAADGESMLSTARDRLLATVGPSHAATQYASARLAEYLRRIRDAEAARILAEPAQG